MPRTPTPTPTRAPSMFAPAATSEPNVSSRTRKATRAPTSSVGPRISGTALVSEPPISAAMPWSRRPAATASSSYVTSSACSSSMSPTVTCAMAVAPSAEIEGRAGSRGSVTASTPGIARACSKADVSEGASSVTRPPDDWTTSWSDVVASPVVGNSDSRVLNARLESVPGTSNPALEKRIPERATPAAIRRTSSQLATTAQRLRADSTPRR